MSGVSSSSFGILQLEELSKEMENGRLFRLVSKLGFVTDRPADVQTQGQPAAWSETGDRWDCIALLIGHHWLWCMHHADCMPHSQYIALLVSTHRFGTCKTLQQLHTGPVRA